MRTLLTLCLATACLEPPKKAYSPAEIASIDTVEEVMRVQAQRADPLFAKRTQDSFSDDEFSEMVAVGEMIDATSSHLAKKFTGTGDFDAGFGDFAKQLNDGAKSLQAAGGEKDAAKAREALQAMKSTCAGCHGVYK